MLCVTQGESPTDSMIPGRVSSRDSDINVGVSPAGVVILVCVSLSLRIGDPWVFLTGGGPYVGQ